MGYVRSNLRKWTRAWLFAVVLILVPQALYAASDLWDVQDPLNGLQFGDFNGDGKTDVFRISGTQWQYSSAGTGAWQNLATESLPVTELRFYDFNGDGKTDVFSTTGSQWRYSSGGSASWTSLASDSEPLGNLRFGDFDGDGKADVFSMSGTQWRYSSGGQTNWTNLATDSQPLANLRFGYFNGDGVTDVFNILSTQGRYSPGGASSWVNLAIFSESLTSLRLGDFNGDGVTDIFNVAGSQWRFSPSGTGGWQNLATSPESLTNLRFGDFDGDGRTDVFNISGSQWRYSSAGVSSWINIGPPDGATLTPTPTPTGTVTATAVPPPPEGCNNILLNGDMESDAHWTFGKVPAPGQYTGDQKHGGLRSVRLGIPAGMGFANVLSFSSIRQQVTVPSNVSTAQLRWWHLYRSEEAVSDSPTNVNDRQEVILLTPQGKTLALLTRVRRNETQWAQEVIDLTPYRGQTFFVYFNAYNDGQGGLTWMFIDDVMVDVCGSTGGGIPMPMPPPPKWQPAPMPEQQWRPPAGSESMPDKQGPVEAESSQQSRFSHATILEVIDGDTVLAMVDGVQESVRYLSITAPPIDQSFGPAATVKNVQLVGGKSVLLERDVTDRNAEGSLLRFVFLDDGTFANLELVKAGLAKVEIVPPNVKYEALFTQAEQEAMSMGRGVWSEPTDGSALAPDAKPAITSTVVPGDITAAITSTVVASGAKAAGTPSVSTEAAAQLTPDQPPNCVELVRNGDFETENVGWQLSGEVLPKYDTAITFNDSTYAMKLGVTDQSTMESVSAVEQTISLPSTATSVILTFRYYPLYVGEPGARALQYADIYNAHTNQFAARPLGVQSNRRAWLLNQYDLTPLIGQDIRLFLAVNNDADGGGMAMVVDEVSIVACSTQGTLIGTEGSQPPLTESGSNRETDQSAAPATPTVTFVSGQPTGAATPVWPARLGTFAVLAGILVVIGFVAVAILGMIQTTR